VAAAAVLRERAERPLEQVVAVAVPSSRTAHPDASEQREIDAGRQPNRATAGVGDIGAIRPERRRAIVEPGRRLRHLEAVRSRQRAPQVGNANAFT
jgi:hypothetical protein